MCCPDGPRRCPDCDPATAAGYTTCGDCQACSYPLDACWITDRLILVTFEDGHTPECRGPGPRTVLLDQDAEDETIPRIPPRTCRGTVRTGSRRGQPCTKPAAAGSAYCAQHDPDRETAR